MASPFARWLRRVFPVDPLYLAAHFQLRTMLSPGSAPTPRNHAGQPGAESSASTSRGMPTRYWLVFGMFLLSMLLYVDRVCISAAKDDIARDLRLTNTQMGWVLSIFALGYALVQIPSGLLT